MLIKMENMFLKINEKYNKKNIEYKYRHKYIEIIER